MKKTISVFIAAVMVLLVIGLFLTACQSAEPPAAPTLEPPATTAAASVELTEEEKALAAGCTGYIEKPINPDTFIAEIEKYL